ncbi:MAG: hypothetical protein KZQ90_02250 [Candidatus Thiodiazotropha sp. (ex Codakia rugifera)]|nr:hypothetical protein [Candidatus Thiodiazotropha sp. (ex Codakia rugifera)]
MLVLQRWISESAKAISYHLDRPPPSSIFTIVVYALLLTACASEVFREPAVLNISERSHARNFVVVEMINIKLDSGYERKIDMGTSFTVYGTLPQGLALKPTKTVFTIEGAHMHEAFPVIGDDKIVGFYLPVERAFSPLSNHVKAKIKERKI